MVESVPVSNRITIVNSKERYANGHIKPDAAAGDLLAFAQALNGLQYNAPADAFLQT